MMPTLRLLPVAALTCALAAQTTIAPQAASVLGNSNANAPFAWWPHRYQQLYDSNTFSHGTGPFTANGVRFRMDPTFANGTLTGNADVQMWMAQAAPGVSSTQFSRLLDNNVAPLTKQLVVRRTWINLPLLSNSNFAIAIPFDAPYTLHPSAGTTIMEVSCWGNDQGNAPFIYPLDAVTGALAAGVGRLLAWTPTGGTTMLRTPYAGCPNQAGRLPTHGVGNLTALVVRGRLDVSGYSYVPTPTPGVLVIGGMPSSLTLPGTSCTLMQSMDIVLPGLSSGSLGQTQFQVAIPDDPALDGAGLYTQQWWIQPNANPFGLFASPARLNTVGQRAANPDTLTLARSWSSSDGLVTMFY